MSFNCNEYMAHPAQQHEITRVSRLSGAVQSSDVEEGAVEQENAARAVSAQKTGIVGSGFSN